MKIAVLIRNYKKSSGGAERYCVELTEKLAINHEVHVYAQQFEERSKLITFHRISKFFERPRFLNQLLFSWLTKRATAKKFDVVHSHELVTHADIYTIHVPCFKSILIDLFGYKKILGWMNTVLSPRKIFYLWLEKQQMKQIPKRQLISVSEYLSRNISQCYPLVKNISIAHPGINENFVKKNLSKTIKLRNLKNILLIPDNGFLMLLVANDFKKKGLPTIIKSLEILNNKDLHLIVAGNGNPKKHYIPDYLLDNIHFLGSVEDMSKLYSEVDLLIHPTLADTYGMAPLEAMSMKLPVIISNKKFCGFSEHLNNNEALLLENPRDEDELSSKINYLYKDTDKRNMLAQNGFEKVGKITWEITLKNTLDAYNSIT